MFGSLLNANRSESSGIDEFAHERTSERVTPFNRLGEGGLKG